jgi:SAM domain (Sterile alpha motif)
MDVGAWLRGPGLGQYEGTFRESEIEADVLPELTEADLEKLGLPLGPRKRILKAIANTASETASLGRPSPDDAAERLQSTVMFCDLAGSTALSARLDPEDMRLVIRAYQDACSGMVARYDGFVSKFMGDGIQSGVVKLEIVVGYHRIRRGSNYASPEPLHHRIPLWASMHCFNRGAERPLRAKSGHQVSPPNAYGAIGGVGSSLLPGGGASAAGGSG